MADLRQTLRAAAWKLTLARAAGFACVVVAAAAGAWALVVLAAGKSPAALAIVLAAAGLAIIAGAWRSRSGALEAARRVEQTAGWQEKLSTAVELERAEPDNAFYGRLRVKVDQLLRDVSPARVIPWNLQRPAVVASVLVVVAFAVTMLLPGGLWRSLATDPGASHRRQAADILQAAADRLDERSGNSPRLGELRLRLVTVLNAIRGDRPVEEVREDVSSGLAKAQGPSEATLSRDAKAISAELAKSKALVPVSEATGRLDPAGVASAAQKTAEAIPGMTPEERGSAAQAFRNAAGESKSSGLADPLKAAGKAIEALDADRFRKAMQDFADAMDRRVKQEASESQAVADVREAFERASRVLAGQGDPGIHTAQRATGFFVAGKPSTDNATGAGNLFVPGKSEDIKRIWTATKAVDADVPQLNAVIESGNSAIGQESIDPAYRDYVRKYFTPEADNR